MRRVRWMFIIYMLLVAAVAVGLGVAFCFTPPRDPTGLYLPYFGALRTLDPAEVTDVTSADFTGLVNESLYNFRFGKSDPYELMPEIAAEMPEMSADGLVMTIRLRKGIHFYDPEKRVFPDGQGPEVKASDVIYSYKRICDFNLGSAAYSQVFQGQIAGLDDWWNYTQHTKPADIDWDRPVQGFQVVDDHTIRIVLAQPNYQMVYNLENQCTGIVSRDAVKYWIDHKDPDQFRWHPVGTGPYCLTDFLRDQRLIFQANPIYRGRPDMDGGVALPDSQRLPRIERVEYDYMAEEVPMWLMFTQGLFDSAGIPKEAYSQAIHVSTGDLSPELAKKGIVLRKTPEAATDYLGFNMQDPILGKNKPLRQAISMALDRQMFIRNFLNGRGIAAIGPVPPGFPTYDSNYVNPYTQFNLDAAREKVQEAIKINGGPIPPLSVLMRDSDTIDRQMGEFYASQARQIGITINPEYRDFARWISMVDQRQTQLFDGGWDADYPDEQDFLQLFYGKNAPAGGVNSAAYVNPEFDKLYDQASVMPDSPERRKLYWKMQQIVMEDCPWAPLDYPLIWGLHYDWLAGGHYMDYGYGAIQNYTIDQALRVRRSHGGS